jgi:c-di-GMP-binding flagellar brake protein YcgR
MITARVFQDCIASAVFERRRFQRLPIAMQAELRVRGTELPIRVETADISAGGCYVEMAVTVDVGTALDVVLWLGHEKLVVRGRVVTRHPHFGNGIEFVGVSPDDRQKLQLFLDAKDPNEQNAPIATLGQDRLLT